MKKTVFYFSSCLAILFLFFYPAQAAEPTVNPPTNVKAIYQNNGVVKITWTPSTSEIDHYLVYRDGRLFQGGYSLKNGEFSSAIGIDHLYDLSIFTPGAHTYQIYAVKTSTDPLNPKNYAAPSEIVSINIPEGSFQFGDGIISRLELSPASPKVNEIFTVKATIKNIGNYNIYVADNFPAFINIKFDKGDGKVVSQTWPIPGNGILEPNEAITLELFEANKLVYEKTGQYSLEACINCQQNWSDGKLDKNNIPNSQLFRESNTDNNFISQPVTIGQSADTTPPSAPLNIRLLESGFFQKIGIAIFWTIPSDPDYNGVKIYRSQEPGSLGRLINTVNPQPLESKEVSAADFDLIKDQTYYYTLHAIDRNGNESKNTDQHQITFTGTAEALNEKTELKLPQNVKTYSGWYQGKIPAHVLEWDNINEPIFLNIYRSDKPGERSEFLEKVSPRSYGLQETSAFAVYQAYSKWSAGEPYAVALVSGQTYYYTFEVKDPDSENSIFSQQYPIATPEYILPENETQAIEQAKIFYQTDADNDQLPDAYEKMTGLDLGVNDANKPAAGSDLTNLQRYQEYLKAMGLGEANLIKNGEPNENTNSNQEKPGQSLPFYLLILAGGGVLIIIGLVVIFFLRKK